MIENVRFIAADGILLAGYINGTAFQLPFSDIEPYWSYANEDDFEYGFAKIFDDKLLITLLTASSQGGVVVLWDAYTETIEHVSDGSFCIAVDMDDEKVYKLLNVATYTTESNLQVWEAPLGMMDASGDGKRLATGIQPPDGPGDAECSLRKLKDGFEIKMVGKVGYIITVDLT